MSKMKLFIALVVCFCINYGSGVKLPQTLKRCKVAPELDNKPNDCLRDAVENAVQQLAVDGNSDIGVPDIDPLKIDEVRIEQGDNSPIAIKLKFTNNLLQGIGDLKVISIDGKISSPKDFKMRFESTVDILKLSGPYSVDGKILVLPIQGDGNSNMTFQDVRSIVTIKAEPQTRKGKEYLRVTSFKIDLTIGRMILTLENLFNGDKALGDNMNKFLNENWKDIFQELKPSVETAFSAIFESYAKRILERVQFKNIFLVE